MAKSDCSLKLVMLGDDAVGKSCLLHRFFHGTVNLCLNATIGAVMRNKMVELDGKKIKLEIWDTAGHKSFRKIIPFYCSQAKGVMLMYDVTDERTFDNLKDWISLMEEHAPSDADRIILGTKCDLDDRREVSKERGEKLAIDYGIKFLETSTKSGINVEEAFLTLARDIMTRLDKNKNMEKVCLPQNDNNAPGDRRCSLL